MLKSISVEQHECNEQNEQGNGIVLSLPLVYYSAYLCSKDVNPLNYYDMSEKFHKRKWAPAQKFPRIGDFHYRKFVSRRKILATSHSSEERELMFIVDWQLDDKT